MRNGGRYSNRTIDVRRGETVFLVDDKPYFLVNGKLRDGNWLPRTIFLCGVFAALVILVISLLFNNREQNVDTDSSDDDTYLSDSASVFDEQNTETPIETSVASSNEYPGDPISKGAVGDNVLFIQKSLNEISRSIPGISRLDEDGNFGSLTETNVKEFQRKTGLVDDGVVGNITWNMLLQVKQDPMSVDWWSNTVEDYQTEQTTSTEIHKKDKQDFTFYNDSNIELYYFYVTPSYSDEWGSDLFGDYAFEAGESLTITFDEWGDVSYWNIKIIDCYENEGVWSELDLYSIHDIHFNYDDNGGMYISYN